MQPPSHAPRQLAAADLAVGQVVAQREIRLDAQAFAQFAALTGDAHPIHYDAGYAQRQGLRAPIAHGLLLVAISALGATPLSAQLHDAMVAMVGVEAVFMRPVYVDETVQCVYRVTQIEHVAKGRSKTTIAVSIHTTDAPPDAARQAHCVVHLTFLLKTHLQG
ncbi:MaoC family dehydratase [Bordetella bronchiseptica]|uniref:MaoC family dehydratase n=1 Tax=Bordetella bronchiseptica TaxID=518 RepID=UPI000460EE90|nr:MaoC family dehydratase [Bordetella bronchiseptica]KDC43914.1 MaoC-like protein [Bordetella bronchiseptica M85/00/2]